MDRVTEHVHEDDQYKFKVYVKDGTPMKEIKDQ